MCFLILHFRTSLKYKCKNGNVKDDKVQLMMMSHCHLVDNIPKNIYMSCGTRSNVQFFQLVFACKEF